MALLSCYVNQDYHRQCGFDVECDSSGLVFDSQPGFAEFKIQLLVILLCLIIEIVKSRTCNSVLLLMLHLRPKRYFSNVALQHNNVECAGRFLHNIRAIATQSETSQTLYEDPL